VWGENCPLGFLSRIGFLPEGHSPLPSRRVFCFRGIAFPANPLAVLFPAACQGGESAFFFASIMMPGAV